MSEQGTRPREVVTASVMTIVGSVLALATIFSEGPRLRSAGMRREVEDLVKDAPFGSVDLSVEQIINTLHGAMLALAAACVAAIVLAVYVMRGHRPSRVALTVLGLTVACLSVLAGVAGVIMGVFIAYSVSLLWKPESRAWFKEDSMSDDKPSGSTPDEPDRGSPPRSEPPAAEPGGESPSSDSPAAPAAQPRPYTGYGRPAGESGQDQLPSPDQPPTPDQPPSSDQPPDQPAQQQPWAPPQGPPYGQPGYGQQPPNQPSGGPPQPGYGQPYPPQGNQPYGQQPPYGQQ
ncbi:MAG: hypothetical protein ACRDO1_10630, partial [Nocardioidaceae bacterium]